jgi:hypothetical protein
MRKGGFSLIILFGAANVRNESCFSFNNFFGEIVGPFPLLKSISSQNLVNLFFTKYFSIR